MKELTLQELMEMYLNLESIKAKYYELKYIPQIQNIIEILEKQDPLKYTWDRIKDYYGIEKIINDKTDPKYPVRFYFVSVCRNIDRKEKIGVIIFRQQNNPNNTDYKIEHFTVMYWHPDALIESNIMVPPLSTFTFRSKSEIELLKKATEDILNLNMPIVYTSFNDLIRRFGKGKFKCPNDGNL